MTSEGASAPGITKRNMTDKKEQTGAVRMRGSVTIEASVGIPLFLFASVCLIWMIEVQSIRISILTAAQSAAKSAAEDTAILPVLNTIKLKKDIISFIGEDRINRSIIQGGTSGISCWKSHVYSFLCRSLTVRRQNSRNILSSVRGPDIRAAEMKMTPASSM